MAKLKYEDTITYYNGVQFKLPPLPPEREIRNYEKKSADQKWERPIFPSQEEYERLPQEKQLQIIVEDQKKRRYGEWIFINGEPVWIPPNMYFYLTHWFMNADTADGYPEYRWAIKQYMIYNHLCIESPNILGTIALTAKRVGKTEIALATPYNMATSGLTKYDKNGLYILQHLTATEAREDLFKGRVMRSHRRIQPYLRPQSNDENGTVEISSNLTFTGSKENISDYLNNTITHRPTKESAVQGKKPRYVYADETPTIEEMDFNQWLRTTRQQCVLGNKIVGKIFIPATPEHMKGRNAIPFKETFYKSDPRKLSEINRTESWFYSYFIPYFDAMEGFIDQYGNPDVDGAKRYIEAQYNMADDAGKTQLRRQYPPTIEAAFDIASSQILEEPNVLRVKDRLKELLKETGVIKRYNLYGYGKEVRFSLANKDDNALFVAEDCRPGVQYIIGVDPTASSKQVVEQGSKFSFVVFKCYDHPEKTNFIPVAYYEYRPNTMEQAYEMLYLTTVLYSQFLPCKVLGESNVGQGEIIKSYFKSKNALQYLVRGKNNSVWVTRDVAVKEKQFYLLNKYIAKYCQFFPFGNILEQLLQLEQSNTDVADAFLMCLLQLGDIYGEVNKYENREGTHKPKPRMRLVRDSQGKTKQVWDNDGFEELGWKM